jgi:hypothetical protein
MAENQRWGTYERWHDLLDALCIERGHFDNLTLAGQLCAANGNRTRGAFETAVKNLRNWRQGVHIPQRKNFALLGKLLEVQDDAELRQAWNRLYSQKSIEPERGETTLAAADASSGKPAWPFIAGGGALAAMILAGIVFAGWSATAQNADPVGSYEGIVAEYVRNVSARVGDSMIIHGARGNECGEAPSWDSARILLPSLQTGTLTDGGVGTRQSRQCGGRVAARAILFTATAPGTEQISLYGDDIVIRVTE